MPTRRSCTWAALGAVTGNFLSEAAGIPAGTKCFWALALTTFAARQPMLEVANRQTSAPRKRR
jgi:hypothetical protein